LSRNARARLTFWSTPAFGVLMGVVYLVAAGISGHPGLGLALLALMVVFSAALVLVSRRSETVRGLLDHRDERMAGIDLRATAVTGLVLILVVIGAAELMLAGGRSDRRRVVAVGAARQPVAALAWIGSGTSMVHTFHPPSRVRRAVTFQVSVSLLMRIGCF
jgi:hypothetical protein